MNDNSDLLAYAKNSSIGTDTMDAPEQTGNFDFEEYSVEVTHDTSDVGAAFGIVTTGFEPLEVTEAGSKIAGYITTSHRNVVRLGTYVIVPYGDENLFARIWKLQYQQQFEVDDATEIHSRRMLKSNTTAELDYKFLAYLEPICILYEQSPGNEDSLTRRMADRIPLHGTSRFPADSDHTG